MHRLAARVRGLGFGPGMAGAGAGAVSSPVPTWAWRASDLSLAPYIGSGTPTVTRAGNTATRINSSGLIETVNANLARYDYSLAGVLQGLLVEPAATNIALRNNDLTNAVWVKGATATAAKDQTGPDGVANSASLITGGAVNTTNTVLQTVVLASSVRKMSAYVKRVTGSGTIEMTTNGGTNWDAFVPTSSWARYDITARTVTNPSFGFRVNTNGDQIAVAFIQNETGVLTSPTTEVAGTAVTRDAEYISVATSSIGGFSASTLTLIASVTSQTGVPPGTNTEIAAGLSDTGANYVILYRQNGSTNVKADIVAASVNQSSITLGTDAGATSYKIAVAAALNDVAGTKGGAAPATDSTATMPTLTNLVLGNFVASGSSGTSWRGHLSEIKYYNRRLPDATLQTLTE